MNKNFYFDPQKQGYDTAFWKTLSGSPAVAANELVFNSATAISYADLYSSELTMRVTFPVAPTAGQDKRIGLAQLNLGAYLGFRMNGAAFSFESIDGEGNTTNTAITWDAAWTAAPVNFKVIWHNYNADFYINTRKVATLNAGLTPNFPLSIYVKNGNADDLKLAYLQIRNADLWTPTSQVNATIQTGDLEIGAVEIKNGTDDTRATVNSANELVVGGKAASGAADSGNPVKVGGVYNTTQPTLTNGQRGDAQLDARGNLRVSATQNVIASSVNITSVGVSFGTITKANLKGSAGNVRGIYVTNTNAAVRYFQIHDKATAPAGTDVPVASYIIPAGTATAPATLFIEDSFFGPNGKYLATGVGWAISTTNATFTDSATASEHNVEVNYV